MKEKPMKEKSIKEKSIFIKKLTPQFKTRMESDCVFDADGEFKYRGIINKNIEFAVKHQAEDKKLWKLISEQFSKTPDDEDNGWRGEYWGKVMRGACKLYEYTKSDSLYAVLKETVADLISYADEYGRISCYSIEKEFNGWDVWARKYVMLGLLHFYDICKEKDFQQKVLNALVKHADYMLKHIGDEDGKTPINMTSSIWGNVNSCTILEPIVRLYNLTDDKKYLDFAKHIIDTGMSKSCNLIELAYENDIPPFKYPVTKSYEMMSAFEGILEYYRVTKIEKYKIAAENFVNALADTEDSVIGCLGCNGECFDNAKITQVNDETAECLQETCVTVTWMKLCLQMYDLTGDIKYIENIEKSYYNAMCGSVNHKFGINNVGIYPFDSYSPLTYGRRGTLMGGLKYMGENKESAYGCCVAIGAMGLGIIPFISFMADDKGYIFNMYESGSIKIKTSKGTAEFKEESKYPTQGEIDLSLSCEDDFEAVVRFRIPKCAENPTVIINGEIFKAESGTYFEADRVWKNNDTVKIRFDYKLKKLALIGTNTDKEKMHICFKYGPFVLARNLRYDKNAGTPVKNSNDFKAEVVETDKEDYLIKLNVYMDDTILHMIDYGSSGKTLNETSITEAWLSVDGAVAYSPYN